jgi:drug/metabolite transporter (DMT)-like permease
MFALKISIILQLTGALDALAGVLLLLFAQPGGLSSGLMLVLVGSCLFVLGRLLLSMELRRFRFQPDGEGREAMVRSALVRARQKNPPGRNPFQLKR